MSENNKFWSYFNSIVSPQLGLREKTFRKIFSHLDKIDGPINIVETGCARQEGNWSGDGQSTVVFDKYINFRDNISQLFSVDINPTSINECKRITSNRTSLTCEDSVHYLSSLAAVFEKEKQFISLLYLDSFDLDNNYWFESSAHHLKELTSVMRCINKQTLVVVDDCPLQGNFIPKGNGEISLITNPIIGGKGRLIAEYALSVHAKLEFAEYQAGWTGF